MNEAWAQLRRSWRLGKGPLFCLTIICLLSGWAQASDEDVYPTLDWEDSLLLTVQADESMAWDNRLRALSFHAWGEDERLTAHLAGDLRSRIKEAGTVDHALVLHRAYLSYEIGTHRFQLGRQRVPFGVGRIWNPLDLFNPINVFSPEAEERPGSDALYYGWSPTDLATWSLILAEEQAAASMSHYLRGVEAAFVVEEDEAIGLQVVGWQLSGEWLESGLELRSEGGYFSCRTDQGIDGFDFLVGAEYALPAALSVLAEWRFFGAQQREQLGMALFYEASLLLTLELLTVFDLSDGSSGWFPQIGYSLSDDVGLHSGCFFYQGSEQDFFGQLADQCHLRYYIYF